ncbi:hypothetical protein R1sor_025891 [Riccia sorocarpa]|uniref:Uncharacterized protein n=1 Tax=Riccia sorocarpa TaxID=122646 RepID=A0ABD3G9W2_9MARC
MPAIPAAESANTFQRFLPEQHTEQLTPVVLEHKINEGGEQQEHQDDHGRMLSWKPPKKPPPRDPPENHTGYRPPPPI